MGVPVVTLTGEKPVSRMGASVLTAIGLPDLIARTQQQYVDIAAALAENRARIRELRESLRQRMQQSPILDAERFTRNLESAYRWMWKTWCQTG
jgi:predicted O-linked N-acetylglucosamine transferase (SPINDLY family)